MLQNIPTCMLIDNDGLVLNESNETEVVLMRFHNTPRNDELLVLTDNCRKTYMNNLASMNIEDGEIPVLSSYSVATISKLIEKKLGDNLIEVRAKIQFCTTTIEGKNAIERVKKGETLTFGIKARHLPINFNGLGTYYEIQSIYSFYLVRPISNRKEDLSNMLVI